MVHISLMAAVTVVVRSFEIVLAFCVLFSRFSCYCCLDFLLRLAVSARMLQLKMQR